MQDSLSFLICKREILLTFFGLLWSLSGLLLTKYLIHCLVPRESSVSVGCCLCCYYRHNEQGELLKSWFLQFNSGQIFSLGSWLFIHVENGFSSKTKPTPEADLFPFPCFPQPPCPHLLLPFLFPLLLPNLDSSFLCPPTSCCSVSGLVFSVRI